MTPSRLIVSVVICAYTEERWEMLVAAVASIRSQLHDDDEVVVVIDHNANLHSTAARSLRGVVLITNDGPRGLSGARSAGVRAAKGQIIAFIDDDAVADPGWLTALARPYRSPHVLGVGGTAEAAWAAGRPRWFPAEFDWVVGCAYRGMPTVPAPVRNLIGCNMSFRASILRELGDFRSEIGRIGDRPIGGEETELCIRLRKRHPTGILLFEPSARVRHHVPASRSRWRYFCARCFSEGISKAAISRLTGSGDALETEWSYSLRTLPLGVARGLSDVVARRDAWGLARAAAIMVGLGITTAGYAWGLVTSARGAD